MCLGFCGLGFTTRVDNFCWTDRRRLAFYTRVVGQHISNSIPIATRYLGGQPFKKGPFHLGIFSMPVSIIAVLWMWFMTIVLMFPATPGPGAPEMNYTVVVFGDVLFLAVVYYYIPIMVGGIGSGGPSQMLSRNFLELT
ncbi:hypothetical protein B0H19DRAFT_1072345 [Mycena capillaripes]|nr:hypothetical protein B0H19DRAFT_1072345 [Mycena capillaripes]